METQELTLHNELKRKSIFLRDYTTELYASGATTIRIEKNLGRIAEQWHTKADFSVLPTCIVLNLWDENEEKSYTVTGKIPADRINFNTVSDLSSLSWKVVEEDLDVCKATARFRDVLQPLACACACGTCQCIILRVVRRGLDLYADCVHRHYRRILPQTETSCQRR